MSGPMTGPQLTSQEIARGDLSSRVATLRADGWRLALVAAHEDPPGRGPATELRVVYALLKPVNQRTELTVRVPLDDPWVPSLAEEDYPAGRFEREMRDLFGIEPRGHPLPTRLVHHAHWPEGYHPMRRDAGPPALRPDEAGFPFLEVSGPGIYEIPVGPIHAGLIEPGHFRFSVLGETIVRMMLRLWFVHRGVEAHMAGREPADAIGVAERVSGDTAVGHALAYAQAVEAALGVEPPEQALLARALLLELERLYNHIGDLGAIVNDVAFGVAHQHTQRLKESLLRHHADVTGHRLLRGGISIGGGALRAGVDVALIRSVADEVERIVELTLSHGVIRNRLTDTGVLTRDQAAHIGALGYAARASGLAVDARADHPFCALGPDFAVVTRESGDVLARYEVRAAEIAVSARLVAALTAELGSSLGSSPTHGTLSGLAAPRPGASGDVTSGGVTSGGVTSGGDASLDSPASGVAGTGGPRAGVGIVEAWRGTLVHRVELTEEGRLSRVKIVDPSWFTWPALPVSLADTIVPDFPLVNKSFNLSYAGNDL